MTVKEKKLKNVVAREVFRLVESETAPVWTKTGASSERGKTQIFGCVRLEKKWDHYNVFNGERIVFCLEDRSINDYC